MSTYSNRLQPALQNLLQRVVWFFGCLVHDDLGQKNQTTRYILPRHWLYE